MKYTVKLHTLDTEKGYNTYLWEVSKGDKKYIEKWKQDDGCLYMITCKDGKAINAMVSKEEFEKAKFEFDSKRKTP